MSRRRGPPVRVPPGIEVRHSKSCGSARGESCECEPTFRAWVSVPGGRKKLQRTFKTLAAATTWRGDGTVDGRRGVRGDPAPTTVREAAEEWLRGAQAGSIRNRSGDE